MFGYTLFVSTKRFIKGFLYASQKFGERWRQPAQVLLAPVRETVFGVARGVLKIPVECYFWRGRHSAADGGATTV